MLRKSALTLCLILTWLLSSTTPVMSAPLSTPECSGCVKRDALLDEAETVIVELLDENAGLLIELEDSWTSCERIVAETATEAVAVAVRPLLVEIAGLEAHLTVVERSRIWIAAGSAVAGVAAGVVAWHFFVKWTQLYRYVPYPRSAPHTLPPRPDQRPPGFVW